MRKCAFVVVIPAFGIKDGTKRSDRKQLEIFQTVCMAKNGHRRKYLKNVLKL